jgi:hypothetical protein
MPINTTAPPPPPIQQPAPEHRRGTAPIADVREKFQRSSGRTGEDEARTGEFIDGKIEMIRRDPRMTDAEKAAAIADLEARR